MSASPSIVLQKSFCTDDQKFCGLQARLSCKDVRGPHRLTLNSQATSVTRLRLYESAIASRFVFSRKIRRPATFDPLFRTFPTRLSTGQIFRSESWHGLSIASSSLLVAGSSPSHRVQSFSARMTGMRL